MLTTQDFIAGILHEYKLDAGIIVDGDGFTLAQSGEFQKASFGDLLSALIGPYGNARSTFDSLQGQVLPRIFSQGTSFAFVDKLTPELMLIVFGQDLSSIDMYHLSKRLSASSKILWGNSCE